MKRSVQTSTLKWGISRETGDLKYIGEVRNGKACDCLCPDENCSLPLEAVHPEKKSNITPHFRHRADHDGLATHCKNQEAAVESAIHKLGKEIILKEARMYLYPYKYSFPVYKHKGLRALEIDKFPSSLKVPLSDLKAEKRDFSSEYQPDLSCLVEGKPFAIEIKRTHAVQQNKVDKLKRDSIAAVEIDLSRVPNSFDRHTVKQAINDKRNFHWLNFPKEWVTKKVLAEIEEYHNSEIKRIDQLVEQENKARELERIRVLEYEKQRAEEERLANRIELAERLMLLVRDIIGTYDGLITPFAEVDRLEIRECYRSLEQWSMRFSSIISSKTNKDENIWCSEDEFLSPSLKKLLDDKLRKSKTEYVILIKSQIVDYFEERLDFRLELTDSLIAEGWNGAALRLDSLGYTTEGKLQQLVLGSITPLLREKIEGKLNSLGVLG